MTNRTSMMKRAGLVAAIAALTASAACSTRSASGADDALKADLAAANGSANANDLQLAPSAAKSQVVVSAIEGGPESAPKPAAPKVQAPKRTPKPVAHVAQQQAQELAPQPVQQAPVQQAPAPAAEPVIEAPAPAPAPRPTAAPAPNRDPRVYKTEGEIFKQMPWIRP